MVSRTVQIGFVCNHCGGEVVSLPDDHTDESDAWCKGCGVVFGSWGSIRRKAEDAAKSLADLGGGFDIPGVKPFRVQLG